MSEVKPQMPHKNRKSPVWFWHDGEDQTELNCSPGPSLWKIHRGSVGPRRTPLVHQSVDACGVIGPIAYPCRLILPLHNLHTQG